MNNRINPAPFSGVFDPRPRSACPALRNKARAKRGGPAEKIFLKTIHPALSIKCGIHPRSKLRGIRERCWINKKGITIIELVVVMIIIAIGAVLIAPNIGAWLPNYRLRSATRDIVSTLRTAQMKAVSSNLEYRVSFANQTFLLQKGNQSSGSTSWTNEGVAQTLPTGITMSGSLYGSDAHFNPNSTCSTGSLTLTSSKGTKKITLTTSTGRVKVE